MEFSAKIQLVEIQSGDTSCADVLCGECVISALFTCPGLELRAGADGPEGWIYIRADDVSQGSIQFVECRLHNELMTAHGRRRRHST
jgi:hypothetical protein